MLSDIYEHLSQSKLPNSLKNNSLALALREQLVEDSGLEEFRPEYSLLCLLESEDLTKKAQEIYPDKSRNDILILLKDVEKYLNDHGITRNSQNQTVALSLGEDKQIVAHVEEMLESCSVDEQLNLRLLLKLLDFHVFQAELGDIFECSKLEISLSRYPGIDGSEPASEPFECPLVVSAVVKRRS